MSSSMNRLRALSFSLLCAAVFYCDAVAAANCSVVSATLSFGQYDGLSVSPRLASGVVRVSCTKDPVLTLEILTLTLQLLPSTTSSNGLRVIGAGASTLPFDIYIDLLRTQRWGDGTQGTFTISGSTTLTTALPSTTTDFPVYGRVPSGVSTPSGSYSGLFNINLTY